MHVATLECELGRAGRVLRARACWCSELTFRKHHPECCAVGAVGVAGAAGAVGDFLHQPFANLRQPMASTN